MKKLLLIPIYVLFINCLFAQGMFRDYDESVDETKYNGIIPYQYNGASYIIYGHNIDSLIINFVDATGVIIESHKIHTYYNPNYEIARFDYLTVDEYDPNILWGVWRENDTNVPQSNGDGTYFKYDINNKDIRFGEININSQEIVKTVHQTGVNSIVFASSQARANQYKDIGIRNTTTFSSSYNYFENQYLNTGNQGYYEVKKTILDNNNLYGIINSSSENSFFSTPYNGSIMNTQIRYTGLLQMRETLDFIKDDNEFVMLGTHTNEREVCFFKTNLSGIPTHISGAMNTIVIKFPEHKKIRARKILPYQDGYICLVSTDGYFWGFGNYSPEKIIVIRLDSQGNVLQRGILMDNDIRDLKYSDAIIENNNLVILANHKNTYYENKPSFIKFNISNFNLCILNDVIIESYFDEIVTSELTTEHEYNEEFDPLTINSGAEDLVVSGINNCSLCNIDFNVGVHSQACVGQENGVVKIGVGTSSVPIGASYTYEIFNGSTSSIITSTSFPAGALDIEILGAGTYTIVVTSDAGCTETTTFSITEYPETEIDFSQNKVKLCCDEELNLDGLLQNPNDFVNWQWYHYSLSNPIGTNTIYGLCNATATSYILEATDINGCTSRDTVKVNNLMGVELVAETTNDECDNNQGEIAITSIVANTPSTNVPIELNLFKDGIPDPSNPYTYTTPVYNINFGALSAGNYDIEMITYIDDGFGLYTECTSEYNYIITNDESNCCFAAEDPSFIDFVAMYGNTITTDVVLDGKYYISENIVFNGLGSADGITIDITNCDLVFGDCVKMKVVNGAKVNANNSVFRTCDTDRPWSGITLNRSVGNIFNECTFSNAQIAIENRGESTSKINKNLFLNNHIGVKFNYASNSTYPITGNSFITDDDKPDFKENCNGGISHLSYGVVLENSRLNGHISQNSFINNSIATNQIGVHLNQSIGIHAYGTSIATISENTFTDLIHAIEIQDVYNTSGSTTIIIENNELETNRNISSNSAQISVQNSGYIEVNGNEIKTYSESIQRGFYAIYLNRSREIEVKNNQTEGFNTSIMTRYSIYINIHDNILLNPRKTGISVWNSTYTVLGCNNITLENYQSSGIYMDGTYPFTIKSNCIFDTYKAIELNHHIDDASKAVIRNNFLFNYKYGIFNTGYNNLFVGTNSSFGQNSFISNSNSSVDVEAVNAMSNTHLFHNFGVQAISSYVELNGEPFHSTANCGLQTPIEPAQSDLLDPSLSCLNEELFLRNEIHDNIQDINTLEKTNRYASNYLHILYDEGDVSANEYKSLIYSNDLFLENEKDLFEGIINFEQAKYQEALVNFESYTPSEQYLSDYQYITILRIKHELGIENIVNSVDMVALERIAETEEYNFDNSARGILIHYFDQSNIKVKDFEHKTSDISQSNALSLENDFINVYPNPSESNITVQFNYNDTNEKHLTIYDITGKIVYNTIVTATSSSINIDVSKFANGVYSIQLKGNAKNHVVQKFVKM